MMQRGIVGGLNELAKQHNWSGWFYTASKVLGNIYKIEKFWLSTKTAVLILNVDIGPNVNIGKFLVTFNGNWLHRILFYSAQKQATKIHVTLSFFWVKDLVNHLFPFTSHVLILLVFSTKIPEGEGKLAPNSPRMATTMSSLRISMEPRDTKYSAVSTSPLWTNVSPGGAWVVLNLMARARRQPLVAPRNALQSSRRVLLRWRQISACRHSGKPFRTWEWIKGQRTHDSVWKYFQIVTFRELLV